MSGILSFLEMNRRKRDGDSNRQKGMRHGVKRRKESRSKGRREGEGSTLQVKKKRKKGQRRQRVFSCSVMY